RRRPRRLHGPRRDRRRRRTRHVAGEPTQRTLARVYAAPYPGLGAQFGLAPLTGSTRASAAARVFCTISSVGIPSFVDANLFARDATSDAGAMSIRPPHP